MTHPHTDSFKFFPIPFSSMRSLLIFATLAFLLGFGCISLPGACGGPVCGSDWKTYGDKCQADAAGIGVLKLGECGLKCTDSDGGNVPNSFGTVQYKSLAYGDYCQDTAHQVEYSCLNNELQSTPNNCVGGSCANGVCTTTPPPHVCSNADVYTNCTSPSVVTTSSCSNGVLTTTSTNCPSGFSCANGACVSDICTDSEAGHDIWVGGTVRKGGLNSTDSCLNANQVTEYYCSNNAIVSSVINCPSGYTCNSGICSRIGCSDPDGGPDRYTKSSVTKGDQIYTDYCIDQTTVKEYYCNNDNIFSSDLECLNGRICSNGRCVTGSACEDSDDGTDKYTRGTASTDSDSKTDVCRDGDTVKEYYCTINNEIAYEYMDCSGDDICDNGKCVGVATCTGGPAGIPLASDPKEHVVTESGTLTDSCISDSSVRKYWCDGNHESHNTLNCLAGYECTGTNGKCTPVCQDSDGVNYFNKGIVTYGSDPPRTDYCSLGSVIEYWCTAAGTPESADYNCGAAECADGKCNPPPAHTCIATGTGVLYDSVPFDNSCSGQVRTSYTCAGSTKITSSTTCSASNSCNVVLGCVPRGPGCYETDGGNKPLTGGSVTYISLFTGTHTYSDYCTSIAGRKSLVEYYCSAGVVRNTTYTCSSGGCPTDHCAPD